GPGAGTADPVTGYPAHTANQEPQQILRLDPAWLRYAPLTASGWVAAAAVFGAAFQFADSLLVALLDRWGWAARVEAVSLWVSIPAAVVGFVVVLVGLSLAGY